jgi:hypothetical protein
MEIRTWNSSQVDAYPVLLGRLVANLGSLELALRHAIYLHETPTEQRHPSVSAWWKSLRVGGAHPVNALTSWDPLGPLITKYNRQNPTAAISEDIVDLRDALAHGRILTDDPMSELRLIRFSDPRRSGVAQVEMVGVLSPDWFEKQIHRIHDAAQIVRQRVRELAPG